MNNCFRNFSALTHAVHTGHTDVAEFLLEYGADPNLIENEKVCVQINNSLFHSRIKIYSVFG